MIEHYPLKSATVVICHPNIGLGTLLGDIDSPILASSSRLYSDLKKINLSNKNPLKRCAYRITSGNPNKDSTKAGP